MRILGPQLSMPWPDQPPAIAWHAQMQPVPQHRPQTVQHGRNQRGARTIVSGADIAFRTELQLRWLQAGIRTPLEGPLCAVFEFSGRTSRSDGRRAPRPDVDNMLKACLDAGNGALWSDDRQIVQLAGAIRRWDREATPFIAMWVWCLPAWPVADELEDAEVSA